MTLNKPSGNMYPWAWTWNPIGGRCEHACGYCYVDRLRKRGLKKYSRAPYIVKEELSTKLTIPKNSILFVCSCYDMFGDWVPDYWIKAILIHCNNYPKTTYLFQTKNPFRLLDYKQDFPPNTILGTTLESNRTYPETKAPRPFNRFAGMTWVDDFRTMVSIEPIMAMNVRIMTNWIAEITPEFVSIGADSGKHHLEEPTSEQVTELIKELSRFTEVRQKKNLTRLLK